MKGPLTHKIKSLLSTYELKIIPWSEYQKGIAGHWKSEDPSTIPIFNNPFGIIDMISPVTFPWEIIYFPCAFYEDDILIGYTSIYNIRKNWIRPRGIYILPEFRGRGRGYKMMQESFKLFPAFFHRAFIITKEETAEKFCKYAGMKIVPNIEPLYSEFSKEYLRLLYVDCGEYKDRSYFDYYQFLENNREEFSLGGTNNLGNGRDWRWWKEYCETHKGNYAEVPNIHRYMLEAP